MKMIWNGRKELKVTYEKARFQVDAEISEYPIVDNKVATYVPLEKGQIKPIKKCKYLVGILN